MDDIVWQSTIDGGEWAAKVVHLAPYKGLLTVEDSVGMLVHSEEVSIAYDARFGPDVADVMVWQERVIDIIDNPEKRVLRDDS